MRKANLADAKIMADFIEQDNTVGGIFPHGLPGPGEHPETSRDVEAFKRKYDRRWWPVMRVVLKLAKIFTGEQVDRIIDALIALGDEVYSETGGNNLAE